MIIMGGMAAMGFVSHDSTTSEGPDDPRTISPPPDATGVLLTVESVPVRVTFDGTHPTASYGLLLPVGAHAFPLKEEITFVSAEEGPAAVSVVWLKSTVSTRQTQ
jgi:hypothetical protein